MKIIDDFIAGNPRLDIISDGGIPTLVPLVWKPILETCDVLVAIPDMHLYYYNSPLDGFRCAAEDMLDFLTDMEHLGRRLAERGKRLKLFQLGDLFELWYAHPQKGERIKVHEIWKSHPVYTEIGRLFRSLRVRHIIGNHDYLDHEYPRGVLRLREGKVYMEHGCNADAWYKFSNPTKPFWRPAMGCLQLIRRLESELKGLQTGSGGGAVSGQRAWGQDSGDVIRKDYCRLQDYPGHSLEYYSKLFAAHPANYRRPRICLVGHTHRPFIARDFADKEGIYIDAGAWSYGRSDFAVITNDEAAICHYVRSKALPSVQHFRRTG